MATIAVFLTSVFTSLLAVGAIRKMALKFRIGALPSARKIHTDFKPIMGGFGIFVGLLISVGVATLIGVLPTDTWLQTWHFWVGLIIILVTGFVDDIQGVSALQKFGGQFAAAFIAASGGCLIGAFYGPEQGTLALGWFSYPFTILWIMFIINAVNLLDGLDGLAGGISLIISSGFMAIALIKGNVFLAVLSVAIIGGIIGFLKHNYHPASIFMGDTGSLMLGYLLACLSIEGLKVAGSHQVYFLASLVLLGMPITDTLISFLRRMGRGDHPFKPDKEHIHHRLLKLGLTHIDTVWLMYYLTLLYTILGVLMVFYQELAGAFLFLIALTCSLFWAWRLGYVETRQIVSFGLDETKTPAALRPPINLDRIWHQIAIFTSDIVGMFLALYLTFWFRFQSGMQFAEENKALWEYLENPAFLFLTGFWLLLFWMNGLYRMGWDVSRFDKLLRVSKVIGYGTLFFLLLMNLDLLLGQADKSPLNRNQIYTLGFYCLVMIVCVNGLRLLIIEFQKRLHLWEYTFKNTLLIGTTRKTRNIIRDIEKNDHLLYRIVGVVDRKANGGEFGDYPVLGSYEDLPNLIQQHRIQEIIVTISGRSRQDLLQIIGICDRLQVVVKTLPALGEIVSGKTPGLAGHGLVRVFPENMVLGQWVVKRLMDIFLSAMAILILLPIWLPVGFLIRGRFGKGVLVRIPILGRNGRIFNMVLFRLGKPNRITETVYQGEANSTKLTKFGSRLYLSQLYRIPQLYNVLRGDMSLVGPRPESLDWYRTNQHKLQFLHRRLMVRPGVTGLAQVRYRFNESQKVLKERLKVDIFYAENISLMLDVRVMLRSLLLIVHKPGKREGGKS
ncbi:MAG: sugar transferase [Calditrichia bacterium]